MSFTVGLKSFMIGLLRLQFKSTFVATDSCKSDENLCASFFKESCCQDIPHVHHLLGRNLGEQECQVLRHGIWFVRGGEQTVGLQAPAKRRGLADGQKTKPTKPNFFGANVCSTSDDISSQYPHYPAVISCTSPVLVVLFHLQHLVLALNSEFKKDITSCGTKERARQLVKPPPA